MHVGQIVCMSMQVSFALTGVESKLVQATVRTKSKRKVEKFLNFREWCCMTVKEMCNVLICSDQVRVVVGQREVATVGPCLSNTLWTEE